MASAYLPVLAEPYEDVTVSGHILDSLMLPKLLDRINGLGGRFDVLELHVGAEPGDASHAVLRVHARDQELLKEVLAALSEQGARPIDDADCAVEAADRDGAFPEGFVCTTNLPTKVRLAGRWIEVEGQEMDCGIVVDADAETARCVPMSDVRRGELVVVGGAGLRIESHDEAGGSGDAFHFMGSAVSTEKPKPALLRAIAAGMMENRRRGLKSLVVAGPAVVHCGAGELLAEMIRLGFVDVLFAGNALATHDIESSMYGTSLGVRLHDGAGADAGHEHHLRTINRIRRLGGIRLAVEQGVLTSGIMYECIRSGVDYLLAGSIRDDGPLPDVVTDALEAQRAMRQKIAGVGHCLMVATTLHSIATGNLLPASVRVVCADINPSAVVKLADRGSWQTTGVVTDVEPFLRSLVDQLREQLAAAPSLEAV